MIDRNPMGQPVPKDFYMGHATSVARSLLGKLLVRSLDGCLMAGVIMETEAYQGEDDLGCHARSGRTPRTQVMYGPCGMAYVYFTYGMHWLLNVVAGRESVPAAVLIRSIQPVAGLDKMMELRHPRRLTADGKPVGDYLNGPAKICQALAVDGKLNGSPLYDPRNGLWIADGGMIIPDAAVETSARIGLFSVPEPWKSIPWRFQVKGQPGG